MSRCNAIKAMTSVQMTIHIVWKPCLFRFFSGRFLKESGINKNGR